MRGVDVARRFPPPGSITRQFKVSPACQNESKAFKKPIKQASILPWFDSTPLFMAEVTGSWLREESRSPVAVTWGEGGTPCLALTPLLLRGAHVMGSPLDAHTRPGTDRGDRRAGRDPGLLGAAGRPKNTSPERRIPLEELTGLSETPGSQGRIPGSRRLIPIRAGAHVGAQGCPVGGSDAGDALRVGLRQDMPSCWGLGGTGGFCPPNQPGQMLGSRQQLAAPPARWWNAHGGTGTPTVLPAPQAVA